MRRGANIIRLGSFNQTVVLDAIRRTDGLSRVELAELTGLSAQTLSNICRRLIANGLVLETGKNIYGRGKPRTTLELRGDARHAVGVHLDPAVTTAAVIDLHGRIRAQRRLVMAAAPDPATAGQAIAATITDLVGESAVDPATLLGIGIAVPGPVDLRRGVIEDPPNLPGWHDVHLRDAVSGATGLLVLLDKDVTAAAVAETWWGGLSRPGTAVVIYVGTGIGTGLVVDGTVVRGSSGNAGEIGHIVVDPEGPECFCGQRGCVAVTLAPAALIERATREGILAPTAGPVDVGERLQAVLRAADAGSGPARHLVSDLALGLARLSLVAANLLDVDRIVLGGPYWALLQGQVRPTMNRILRDQAAAHAIHRVKISETSIGESFGAIGAASIVLDQALSPRPSRLLVASRTVEQGSPGDATG